MTLCDTSFFVSLIDRKQKSFAACNQLFPSLAPPLITTWPCITEGMHLLGRRPSGWQMQKSLSSLLLRRILTIYDLESANYSRLFSLMIQYRDTPMDLADASLVLAAEKTGERQILTLDSDFLVYRING